MPLPSFNEESGRGYPAHRDQEHEQKGVEMSSGDRLVVMNDKRLNFYKATGEEHRGEQQLEAKSSNSSSYI